jgi:hypothetical protein
MFKFTLFLLPCAVLAVEPCRIEIVDKENGWPVPLVELRSTHETRHVSDNLGLIAIDDPDLLGREVWFHVKGHGYGVPKDGFGYEGVRTTLKPGGNFRIEVSRRILAKRLGRLTGAGQFAEGEKLGIAPLLPETGVFGCDSVLTARHDGKLFFLWGDTTLPGYPLGIFHSSAATTPLLPLREFKPPLSMPYTYFRDAKEKPRGVAQMPGEGPTWLTGMISFPENRLVATYSKIRGFLEEYEVGLCAWAPDKAMFVPEKVIWKKENGAKPLLLKGHPVRWKDENGKAWILIGDPFPEARIPDDFESWKNPATWEKVQSPAAPRTAGGEEIKPHRGSIAWNSFRKRWTAIFTQNFGKPSAFGEIWYAEADSPFGPWDSAVKVLSHDNYTFYNPRIQTDLTPDNVSFILFEGTYTAEFSDHAHPTPRYNYNQILYRLDLDDARLGLKR